MKYAGVKIVAKVRCERCDGNGQGAVTGGGIDRAPRRLDSCSGCGGAGEVEQELLHAGEPFFLVRGQDRTAMVLLHAYAGLLCMAHGIDAVTPLNDGLARWFADWQERNSGLVKDPD